MKTSTKILNFLIVSCLFLTGLTLSSKKVQANPNNFEKVYYKGSWIQQIKLKEITIFANSVKKDKRVLCQMVVLKNGISPIVQLDEITVTPNVNFLSGDTLKKTNHNSILVENKLHNGKFMPFVELHEINIIAEKISPPSFSKALEAQTNYDRGLVQISVRKTFDRLTNFLVEQGKLVLRKLLPSWFAE